MSAEPTNNIKVVCRFRPQNSKEAEEGGSVNVSFDDDMTAVKMDNREFSGIFQFDKVFDWNVPQPEFFAYSASSIVGDVMKGYNGTVFAYGQTGAGKTFTMMGDIDSDEYKGIIPRIIESIFRTIAQSPATVEFMVKVSYMEIYMEKIRDLLNPQNDNLPVHEDKTRGVYVKGLIEVYVATIDEVYDVMRKGQTSRAVAATNMNAESSRSHTIFVIQISQKNTADGNIRTGKLYLVDLAGSEKVGKTGATGQTLEEAKKINKSLSSLGNVINSLTDGKSSHIPYRDSKLTRILQESLGGNSRTTLVINCSPSSSNEAETLSTLRFGVRAKSIKNHAKINQELSPGEMKVLLKRARAHIGSLGAYIEALEAEVEQWRGGKTVAKENWANKSKYSEQQRPASSAPGGRPETADPDSRISLSDLASIGADETATNTTAVADDEREEFLRRENELADQLSDKETELADRAAAVARLTDEVAFVRQREQQLSGDNQALITEVNDLRNRFDKLTWDSKEATIQLDALQERNAELNGMLDKLKIELEEAKSLVDSETNREALKAEKVAQLMAEFQPSVSSASILIEEHTKEIARTLSDLDKLKESEWDIKHYKAKLAQTTQDLGEKQEVLQKLTAENDDLLRKKNDAEQRLAGLEREYEDLLDRTIAEEEKAANGDLAAAIRDIKAKIDAQYSVRKDNASAEVEELKAVVAQKTDACSALEKKVDEASQQVADLQATIGTLRKAMTNTTAEDLLKKDEEIDKMKKTMTQYLADFDTMKKKLMTDLQNRCEKVIELELSLDEAREKYNSVLKKTNLKAQQQKLSFLERNLEQLTSVQKQLVEQNTALKKDIVLAERKLTARNERITHLENLLVDAQQRMEAQSRRHDEQVAALRDKVVEIKSNSNPSSPATGAFDFIYSSRIAKPLRGGGGGDGTSTGDLSSKTAETPRSAVVPGGTPAVAVATATDSPLRAAASSWLPFLGRK